MTHAQHNQLENDAVVAAHAAKKEANAYRLKLSIAGQHLENLARALQQHPEEVRKLPDPHSLYDYSEGVKSLLEGQKVLALCDELRLAQDRLRTAEQRMAVFTLNPISSQNSED